jgi:hypothetical protein
VRTTTQSGHGRPTSREDTLATSGSTEGVQRYARAVDLPLRYKPGVIDVAEELAKRDAPRCR